MSVDLPDKAYEIYYHTNKVAPLGQILYKSEYECAGINDGLSCYIGHEKDEHDSMVSQLVAQHLFPKEAM